MALSQLKVLVASRDINAEICVILGSKVDNEISMLSGVTKISQLHAAAKAIADLDVLHCAKHDGNKSVYEGGRDPA